MRRLLGKLIPRSAGGRWAAGVGAAAVVAVGIYLVFFVFAFHLIFVDEVVDEEVPDFAADVDIDELISEALDGPATTTAAVVTSAGAGQGAEPDKEVTEQSMSVGEHAAEESGESGGSDVSGGSAAESSDETDGGGSGSSGTTGGSSDSQAESSGDGQRDATGDGETSGSSAESAGTSGDEGSGSSGGTASDGSDDGSGQDSGGGEDSSGGDADGGVRVAYLGSFGPRSHPAEGTAVVLTDGTQTFLRFDDDFATDNGPDLNVYLHTAAPDASVDDLVGDFIDLGDLKGNLGAQNYVVPADVDLDRYSTVSVWCVRFRVVFGTAELMPMN